jgi:predicted molibdopterin-dependent oxidoreductase YjgC
LRRANVLGALDMGLAPGVLPGRVGLDAGREWYRQAWGSAPAEAGLDTAGMLAAAADGKLQVLVLIGADPLTDFPDRELARRGLAGAGFVVAVDTFLTASAREADVVLPVASYAERAGTTTNLEGRVTRLGQKIVPPGVAWADWIVAAELATRMGADLGLDSLDAIWDEIERLAPSHRGMTRAMLRDRRFRDGIVAPVPDDGPPETPEVRVDPMSDPGIDAVETHGETAFRKDEPEPNQDEPAGETGADDASEPAGETGADGASEPAAAVEAVSVPAMLEFSPPTARPSAPSLDAYSLRLVSGRVLYDEGTLVQQSPSLAPLARPARLRANPYDLDRLGLSSGGRVRLSSARTHMVVEVEPDAAVPRGSASLPFNLQGISAAELIDGSSPVTDVRIETVT